MCVLKFTARGKEGIVEVCREYIQKLDINGEDLDRSMQLSADKDSESETNTNTLLTCNDSRFLRSFHSFIAGV